MCQLSTLSCETERTVIIASGSDSNSFFFSTNFDKILDTGYNKTGHCTVLSEWGESAHNG